MHNALWAFNRGPTVHTDRISYLTWPAAKKLAAAWNTTAIENQVLLPKTLKNFIHHFDKYRYPKLIRKSS